MEIPAPASAVVRGPAQLAPALGFVLTGLLGRALIDKALALRGGAELVAHWAQVGSLADIVAGVALAGIGIGLTGRVAGVAPCHQRRLLGEALRLGLLLSTICLLIAAGLALAGSFALLPPLQAGLLLPALGTGWLSVAPGLLIAWLLGRGEPGRATAAIAALLAAPLLALCFATPGAELQVLLGTQAALGLAVTLFLLGGEGSWREALGDGHGLRPFIVAGIAIGILSPAATAIARLQIASAASWEIAGAVQALWRSSEWITAIAAGLLNAHFLPRLAATRDAAGFSAELRAFGAAGGPAFAAGAGPAVAAAAASPCPALPRRPAGRAGARSSFLRRRLPAHAVVDISLRPVRARRRMGRDRGRTAIATLVRGAPAVAARPAFPGSDRSGLDAGLRGVCGFQLLGAAAGSGDVRPGLSARVGQKPWTALH
jgi:hypothetical protein